MTVPSTEIMKGPNCGQILDFEAINRALEGVPASERIDWALSSQDEIGALSSAGTDSSLMISHLVEARRQIPVIFINTGFLPIETLEQRDTLRQHFGINIIEVGPTDEEIEHARSIENKTSIEYRLITKIRPLERVIGEMGIKALLSGVRGDQNPNRAEFDFVALGRSGEMRIHPFLDWTHDQVREYIDSRRLPRNRLYYRGYDSVEDEHNTQPGTGREGRAAQECGLHGWWQNNRRVIDDDN